MTIPPATPDMPAVEVSHGVGALVLTLRDDRGRQLGTVLSPDGADVLADELRGQAAEARRLLAAYHPSNGDGSGRLPHLIVLGALITLIVGGMVVGLLALRG